MAKCSKGKPCGSTCISMDKECRLPIPPDMAQVLQMLDDLNRRQEEERLKRREAYANEEKRLKDEEANAFLRGESDTLDIESSGTGLTESEVDEIMSEVEIIPTGGRTISKSDIEDVLRDGILLGRGSYGRAYAKGDLVVKRGDVSEEEVTYGNMAADLGIGPRIYAKVKWGRMVVMERVEGISQNKYEQLRSHFPDDFNRKVEESMYEQTKKMHLAGMLHGDLNTGNVVVQRDGTVKLIDFAFAKTTNENMWPRVATWRDIFQEASMEPVPEYENAYSPKVKAYLRRASKLWEPNGWPEGDRVNPTREDVERLYG